MIFFILDQVFLSLLGWGITICLLGCYILQKLDQQLVSKLGIIIISNIAVLFYSVALGEQSGISVFFFALVAITFIIFHFRDLKWIKISIAISIVSWIVAKFHYFSPFIAFPKQYLIGLELLTGAMTFFILLASLTTYLMSNEFYKIKSELIVGKLGKANKKLNSSILQLTQETKNKEEALIREQEKAKKIQEQSKKIESDSLIIKRASEIQEKLLKQAGSYQGILFQTEKEIPQPTGQKITVFGSASHHITGDYRYIFQINPHTSAIIALDVTGHGAPAAMMTGVLSKIVDDLFETSDPKLLMDTGKTMEVLNKTLYAERRLDKFVAAVYAVIDTKNNLIHATCAGAETVMIYRDGKIISIKNSNESLRMDKNSKFTSVILPIQFGDIIIICTDGLMDRKLKTGAPLFLTIETQESELDIDYAQFEALLATIPKKESIAASLGEDLDILCKPATDDMTIVAVVIN
jgi:serine phosphatase RsbU (regulator of sigma subunit)